MKKIILLLAAATLANSCQTSQPKIHYTTIKATLAQAIKYGSDMEYAKQTFHYPQLSGMKNKVAQDSLNRLFKLADSNLLSADSSYINVHQASNNVIPEHSRMYSHDEIVVHYVSNDFISYSGKLEFNGGAHPSFVLYPGKTLAIATLAPMQLSDLFINSYKDFFKQQIIASEQLENFTNDGIVMLNEFGNACGDILDALLLQMDTISTTANMVVTDSAVSILQVDYRDFGCPEIMRDVIEVRIPYAQLKPYINPKGYLNRFITK